jgi:hypothetical protein
MVDIMAIPNDKVGNFKVLSEKDIEHLEKQKIAIEKKVIINDAELEAELELFNTITDILYNPNTEKPMAEVRRMSMDEIEVFTGKELKKYKNPEDIPEDVAQKYDDKMYQLIADVIIRPKHDVEWWKDGHLTPELIGELVKHIKKTLEKLGTTAENF